MVQMDWRRSWRRKRRRRTGTRSRSRRVDEELFFPTVRGDTGSEESRETYVETQWVRWCWWQWPGRVPVC
jgi:hypothetical protein